MQRVALVVDNPFRDLPGMVLVAIALARRGVIAHLVPLRRQDVELRALAPDMVVLNYLRSTNATLAESLLEAGIQVSVLDTEGGVMADVTDYDRVLASNRALHQEISCYCGWGRVLTDHVVTAGWYRPEQVVVTGSPRFDFYADPWRAAALSWSRYVEAYTPRLILVNGSFPLANPRFQTAEEEARVRVREFAQDPTWVAEWQRQQKEAMEGMVALVRELAYRFPMAHFVYRPHPFERAETYENAFAGVANADVNKTGTVHGWILRSSAIVQRTCTTAIEAGMAGVPALSPNWLPSPVPTSGLDDASLPCETTDEMSQRIEESLRGNLVMPEKATASLQATISDWFNVIDGCAHDRVAAALATRIHPRRGDERAKARACRQITQVRCRSDVIDRVWRPARLLLKAALPPDVGSIRPGRGERVFGKSEKHFSSDDVLLVVETLQSAAPDRLPAVTVSPAGSGDYAAFIQFGRTVTVRPAD